MAQLYDPVTSSLTYVGKLFANNQARMIDLLEDINGLAGFPPDEVRQICWRITS